MLHRDRMGSLKKRKRVEESRARELSWVRSGCWSRCSFEARWRLGRDHWRWGSFSRFFFLSSSTLSRLRLGSRHVTYPSGTWREGVLSSQVFETHQVGHRRTRTSVPVLAGNVPVTLLKLHLMTESLPTSTFRNALAYCC